MKNKPILAIDLGSSKVACVVGHPQPDHRVVHITGAGVARLPLTSTWPCDPAMLARALDQALEETGLAESVERAVVALSHPDLSHQAVTAQIDVASEPIAIRAREMTRLRAQAVAQALGIDREVLHVESLGYQGNGFQGVRNPQGLLATRLRGTFQLVAMPLTVRRVVRQALEVVGLEPDRVVYSVWPVATACLDPQALAARRILLIDIGGCVTDCSILERGVLSRSSSLAWGGALVAEAVAKQGRMTIDQGLAASLEGLSSPREGVASLVEEQLGVLRAHLDTLLSGEVLPDAAVVTGGGALIDGVAEWLERGLRISTTLGRSPRALHLGDLPRQMALTAAIGLLEQVANAPVSNGRSPHFLHRILDTTKAILTEYF